MITLLFVEDEKEAREGIKRFLPWDTIGIERVEEADDGLAAVGLCEGIRPDILITDIFMPKMDGIQLAIYVRERFPKCKIIFISGYTEKQHLKMAIKIGAASFIDKPVDIQELRDVLVEIVRQCRDDQKKIEEEAYQEALSKEGYPLIIQKLAAGACYFDQDGLTLAGHLDIPCVCMIKTLAIKLHEDAALSEEEGEFFHNDLISYINNGKYGINDLKCASCFIDGRTLIIHCFFTNTSGLISHNETLSEFITILNEKYYSKYVFTAVAGIEVNIPSCINISFKSAQKLLKLLFYRPKGLFYTSDYIDNSVFRMPNNLKNQFDQLILSSTPENVHSWIDNLEQSILLHPMTEIGYVKNLFFEIYEQIYSAAKNKNELKNIIDGDTTYIWQELSIMETLHDIIQFFHSIIDLYFYTFETNDLSTRVIETIKKFIQDHFSDKDLSIKKIAEFSHYDYYYLCSLFKKKAGMTINAYISMIRLRKASDLLHEYHISLQDITGMIGYSDPSYFSKLFKKHYGVTPSEFREKHYS